MKVPDSLKSSSRDEERLLGELDADRLPQHIAVIMDGNGRWARRRHLPRVAGHRAGVQSARTIIETCARLNISALTLYAFSMENWRRPKAEIDFLMRLLREYLRKELPVIHRNNIRLLVIGRPDQLPEAVRSDIERAMEFTAGNSGMKLAVALNYGGRAELVDAFNRILERFPLPTRRRPLAASPAARSSSVPAQTAPVYKKWWFWTGVGVLATGAIVTTAYYQLNPSPTSLPNINAR